MIEDLDFLNKEEKEKLNIQVKFIRWLGEDYSSFLKNLNKYKKLDPVTTVSGYVMKMVSQNKEQDLVSGAFSWNGTDEGHNYWAKRSEEWEKELENELERRNGFNSVW